MKATQIVDPRENTTAVILAGGLGTRLRSVISDRPKVMADVCGRPFIEYILDQVVECGIKKAVLCIGYLAEQVETHLGNSYKSLELSYSREQALLGTGGAVRFALSAVRTDYLLIMNGDSYCSFQFEPFANSHFSKQASASILLTQVSDAARYGRVIIDSLGHITNFEEKGTHTSNAWINAGIYLVAKDLIEEFPPGRQVSLEREVFPHWIQRKSFFGYQCNDGTFIDIGTPQSFALAQTLFGREARI